MKRHYVPLPSPPSNVQCVSTLDARRLDAHYCAHAQTHAHLTPHDDYGCNNAIVDVREAKENGELGVLLVPWSITGGR